MNKKHRTLGYTVFAWGDIPTKTFLVKDFPSKKDCYRKALEVYYSEYCCYKGHNICPIVEEV